jgi:hypothetical protein
VDFLTLFGAVVGGFAASIRFGAFVGALFIAALSFCGGFVWFVGHNEGLVNEVNGRRGLWWGFRESGGVEAVENWRQSVQGQIPFLSHRFVQINYNVGERTRLKLPAHILTWFLLAHRAVIIPHNAEG